MRLLFFAGTGGAGTTTVAAATAVHAARRGVKTLVLAPEPVPGGRGPGGPLGVVGGQAPVEVEPGLFAHAVDARSRGRRAWIAVRRPLAALLGVLGVDPLEAPEFAGLPGLDDVLTLLEVRDAAAAGWDLVVVDAPALARALRLLALPEAAVRTLERALPIERRMLWAMGHGAPPSAWGTPPPAAVEAAERLHGELVGVRDVLAGNSVSVRLVLTPEPAALGQVRHAWTTLALHGLAADGVVVNRLVPGDGDDAWRHARAAAQAPVLADAETALAPLPLLRLTELATPPAAPDDLAEVARELYGDAAPYEDVPATDRCRVERCGEEFVFVMPLPLARREDLELARRGDELLLDLAGERRALPLPSVLRRCQVVSASLRDGLLRVAFRPDPELWRSL